MEGLVALEGAVLVVVQEVEDLEPQGDLNLSLSTEHLEQEDLEDLGAVDLEDLEAAVLEDLEVLVDLEELVVSAEVVPVVTEVPEVPGELVVPVVTAEQEGSEAVLGAVVVDQ